MQQQWNVSSMPKTSSFQMRINPEVKKRVEDVYASCGLTLTEAINLFIQQSINVEGLPFLVTQSSKEALREQAAAALMAELRRGETSVQNENDWISEEQMLAEFGEKNEARYTPAAREDLRELHGYIARELQNPAAADRTVLSVLESCSRLKEQPLMGPELSRRIGRTTDLRYLICGKRIAFYRIEHDVISVLRILDGRTDYLRILFS